jgi:ubiquitin C-terminal hydrolase
MIQKERLTGYLVIQMIMVKMNQVLQLKMLAVSLSLLLKSKNLIGQYIDSTPPFNYQLDSFVSHKGTSVHCGHYVSHVYKHNEWILFNDNKVAVTPNPPVGEAYLYFLRRQK